MVRAVGMAYRGDMTDDSERKNETRIVNAVTIAVIAGVPEARIMELVNGAIASSGDLGATLSSLSDLECLPTLGSCVGG